MRTTLISTLALAALLAAGCRKPAEEPGTSNTSTGGGTSTETPVMPDALKHDGFAYYGLGQDKILEYEFVSMEGAAGSPGTSRADLVTAEDNVAVYSVERSGSLIQLGSERDEVRPDGVYMVEMSIGTLKEPVLSMPADAKVGSTWPSKMQVEAATGATTMEVTNTVEKTEKVTTPAGEFDAILVVSTGTMSQGDKKAKISSKVWYSKDVGIVQLRLESVDAEGKPIKQHMVLTGMKDKEK